MPDGKFIPVKIRSLVGLTSLFAVHVIDKDLLEKLPEFHRRLKWFVQYQQQNNQYQVIEDVHEKNAILLSLVPQKKLEKIFVALLDENEFLAPGGIRSLSKIHQKPYKIIIDGEEFCLNYQPGESNSNLFGGNSNWRGPVWMPMNYLIILALEKYHKYFQDELIVELPVHFSNKVNLKIVADELCKRLSGIFELNAEGKRDLNGEEDLYAKNEYFKDTIRFEEFVFLNNNPLSFKKTVITHNIEFFKGQVFQKNLAEKSYKRLLNLGVFRTVLIQYVKNIQYSDQLDCYIVCQPIVKQAINLETEFIKTSGNYGVDGSILLQNRNLLRGAELLELSLNGAFIAQQQFSDKKETDLTNVQSTFNTIQFGPSLKFSVPRVVFPFSLLPFKKDAFPRTFISTSLNYQSRPEFNRTITTINYGFSFKSNKLKVKHDLIPVEVYMVNAKLTDNFRSDLININDYFLLNSFQDHITTLSKYTITYNNQQISSGVNTSRKPISFIKVNVASSGSILRGIFDATGQPKDTMGRYLILNTPFAQFVKLDVDYRLYIPIRKKSRLVYRTAIGIGKPLKNLNVLPYEQSYFAGGPNCVRAWRARTLGPGGYDQPSNVTAKYDKIGDLLIEGNFEYRFHVFRSFFGAAFIDVGNIWLLNKDNRKPNGNFEFDRFYKEFAVGGGMGIRWDLNFFVLRLDLAAPLADPSYPEGDRWLFGKAPLKRTTLNFGIGYPF